MLPVDCGAIDNSRPSAERPIIVATIVISGMPVTAQSLSTQAIYRLVVGEQDDCQGLLVAGQGDF